MKRRDTSRKLGRQVATSVLIVGYYGRRNVGDEVILGGLLSSVRGLRPDWRFCVVSGDPGHTEKLHGVAAIPWGDMGALASEVERSDLVLVGGGGLIQDYWGLDETSFLSSRQGGISEYGGPLILAHALGKPCMLIGVGVGPLRTPQAREAARQLFEMADRVTVRDGGSQALLAEIGVDAKRVQVAADLGFLMPRPRKSDAVRQWLRKLPRPILGVALRHWSIEVDQDAWELQVARALDRHLESIGGSVVFVPMQDGRKPLEDDVAVARSVREKMARRAATRAVGRDWGPFQRYGLLQCCDLVLGMRLHAAVAGIGSGIPCVGLAYDPKVRNLFSEVALNSRVFPLEDLEADRLAGVLQAAWKARTRQKATLERLGERMRQRALRSIHLALRLGSRSNSRAETPSLLGKVMVYQMMGLERAERELRRTTEQLREGEALREDLASVHQDLAETKMGLLRAQERADGLEQEISAAREKEKALCEDLASVHQDLAETKMELLRAQERADGLEREISAASDLERALRDQADSALQRANSAQEELRRAAQKQEALRLALEESERSISLGEVRRLEADHQAREASLRAARAEEQAAQLSAASARVEHELSAIKSSRGWKMLWASWRVVWTMREKLSGLSALLRFARRGSGRLRSAMKSLAQCVRRLVWRILPSSSRVWLSALLSRPYIMEDNSQVVLYTDNDELFVGYRPRRKLGPLGGVKPRVSLVVTVKNEARTAEGWLRDLESQLLKPDEVILIDGGSQDGTMQILQDYAKRSTLRVRAASEIGANYARGRNVGVRMARNEIVACTDFGCDLHPAWLARLVHPFADNAETEVVAGWYETRSSTRLGSRAKRELAPSLSEIHPQHFLPSARSLAFKKRVWEIAGGFPEWLTSAAEDTCFALELKRHARHWSFVPDALVIWHAPGSLRSFWSKLTTWAAGDGESEVLADKYVRRAVWLILAYSGLALGLLLALALGLYDRRLGLFALGLLLVTALASYTISARRHGESIERHLWRFLGYSARSIGFLRGVSRRPAVTRRKHSDVTSITFLLAGVPIDDTGGGSRGAQMALELLSRGNLVVYLHRFPKQESTDLRLRYGQPHLVHQAWAEFDLDLFRWKYGGLLAEKPITAIVEFPLREFLPLLKQIRGWGGAVVYDLIDDWSTSLGGNWYSAQTEKEVIGQSDLLAASAPTLAERLRRDRGKQVLLMPNAVNLSVFDRHRQYSRPGDLPSGDPILIYIGALWGEWFDWDLLVHIALALPKAAVVVIGDYRGQCPRKPPTNLHFLGLKPQAALPPYLAFANVGLLPWKVSPLTQATSPLKVFEYLAMGRPVVCPRLGPLGGLPYVLQADGAEQFIEKIKQARSLHLDPATLDDFLAENSWQARLTQLGAALALAKTGVADPSLLGW